MTKRQIEKFAVGYPFPTNYVEILLKKFNYDTVRTHEVLRKPYNQVIKEIQNVNSPTIGELVSIMGSRYKKRNALN